MKTEEKEVQSQNIKLVKELYAAFGRRDVQAILNLLSDNVEWGEPENPFNPAGGTRFGHSGFLEWINIGRENEDILNLELRQFMTDSNSVAVIGYMKCMAKPTNKMYESDFVHLITIKDGKIVLFKEFFDTYIAGEAFKGG